jgi:hypothetical protein
MSEKIKPFPDITRLPGEPRLEGAPHRVNQSVLLQTEGLGQALLAIHDFQNANSDGRRSYLKRIEALSESERDQLVNALVELADGDLTDSTAIKNGADELLEKLEPEFKLRPVFETDDFEALADTDTFASHMDAFSDYLTSPNDERTRVVAGYARKLFKDPEELYKHASEAETIIEMVDQNASNETTEILTYRNFNEMLLEALKNLASHPEQAALDRASLVHWMRILCGNSDYSEISERLLATWLNNLDMDTVVDRMHQLATAAYISDDEVLHKKMLDIVGMRTAIMPIDSPASVRYEAALYGISPVSWQKRREIDDAEKTFLTGRLFTNKLQQRRQIVSKAFQEYARKLGKDTRKKLGYQETEKKATMMLTDAFKSWRRLKPQKSIDSLGDDDVIADTPLRRWINERVLEKHWSRKLGRKREITGVIQLPGISRTVHAPVNQVANEVSDALSKSEEKELKDPQHWRTLSLLVPEDLDQKMIEKIRETNVEMRMEIQEGRLRNVSPRGDRIFVTDPKILKLGFRSIEIHPRDNGYELKVDVKGKKFKGSLDKNLYLIDSRFDSHLRMPITSAFLNHVIVCHIHELLCSEFDNEEAENNLSETRRQFYSRRDHRRILPEGEKPTQKQIIKVLFDYDVDLISRNAARVAAGEARLMTWVSAVDRIDIHGSGPVESYAQTATNKLNKILSK